MNHNNGKTKSGRKGISFARQVACLTAIFCLLSCTAVLRDHSLFGYTFGSEKAPGKTEQSISDHTIINTSSIGKEISGYNGPVPLEIHISGGRIDSVSALPNHETPSFFARAATLLTAWDGLTLQEALTKKADAVSGATFSSQAIIDNMHAGIAQAARQPSVSSPAKSEPWSIKYTAALLIALSAAILPLFIKNRKYRIIQQLLNVGVLGFWTGTFLNYSIFIHTIANGLPKTSTSITIIILLIVAFIYPLFGKRNHYCSWICPFGSLQELAGKTRIPKIHMTPQTLKRLHIAKSALWVILMLCLWSGMAASWIDYEIFTVFIVKSASTVILIAGGLFIILSLFMMRPFCRFVCPTGTLLNLSEGHK